MVEAERKNEEVQRRAKCIKLPVHPSQNQSGCDVWSRGPRGFLGNKGNQGGGVDVSRIAWWFVVCSKTHRLRWSS